MNRLFGRFLSALNMLASIWILVLIAFISADVIGRGAFNHPLPGVPEIVRFSIVAMVWLQMAYVFRIGGHLRTTLGLNLMPIPVRKAVLIINMLVGVAMFAMVAWYGWPETVKSWRIGAFEGAHPVRIPIWPIWGIVVAGAVLSAIQCLVEVVLIVKGIDRYETGGDGGPLDTRV